MNSSPKRNMTRVSNFKKDMIDDNISNSFENYVGNNVMSDIPKYSNDDSGSGVGHHFLIN